MPFYRCLEPKDSLTYEQRERIAVAITDVHCGNSTAPRSFVQVAFMDSSPGDSVPDSHGSGQVRYGTPYFVAGGNRAGRSEDTKANILEGILTRVSQIAGVPREMVSGFISEAPGSWTMEAGRILPDPGEEAEWCRQGTR